MRLDKIAFAAAALAFASPALAEDKIVDLSTPAGVAAALQEAGYKAEIKTDDGGEAYIAGSANGEGFTVDFFDCENKHCTSITISSWYKEEPLWTPDFTNEWNSQKRFLRVGIDSKGRLHEYVDITTVGNLTQANFADIVSWYASMDADLGKFIAAKRDAAKK